MLCRGWLATLILTASFSLMAAHGADTNEARSVSVGITESTDTSLWRDGLGSGLRAGTLDAGFALGAGIGMEGLGESTRHDLALTLIQFGRIISEPLAPGRWYGGNFELGAELAAGGTFYPDNAYLVGLSPTLRYHFMTGTPWVPFIEGGAGPAVTDIGLPDLGSKFQFIDHFGFGVNWFHGQADALSVEVRFIHISNAGYKDPNYGVNTGMLLMGWKRFF